MPFISVRHRKHDICRIWDELLQDMVMNENPNIKDNQKRQRSGGSRTYIAIDLKSFYASVECVDRGLDPMTANLVVADPERTETTICLAVSPSLKALGIPGRARLFEVLQKLEEVRRRTGREVPYTIAVPRMAHYIQVSADIYGIYLKYISPEDIHVYSIDECFMDVTEYLRLYQMTAHQLAIRIIRDVLEQTGITATAGIAPNLYLAKIAMDIVAKHVEADRDGVRIAELDEMSYRRLLWGHRPLTDFWRIGHGLARRLEENGMYTMGDIARESLREDTANSGEGKLYRLFGIDAELLIDHAWGIEPCTMADIKSYRSETNSIGSGQVLPCAYPVDKARVVLQEMTDLLALDLVDQGLVTDSVTIYIGFDRKMAGRSGYSGEFRVDHYGRKVPKSVHGTASLGTATASTKQIMEAVLDLYDRLVNPALQVRRMTITANRVTEEGYEQLDLFSDPEEREREKKMQKTMLEIKKKFGKNAILKGMNLQEGATAILRNDQIGGHKA